jgi:myo-inositol-1(or 4)-monophosphatase
MELDSELAVATRLAYKAAAGVKRRQADLLEAGYTEHDGIAATAKLESNALIRAGLAAVFPDDVVCSEDTTDRTVPISRTRVWIVDPLDSTESFMAHGDEYSVSIGLSIDGRSVLGVVCNPVRGELFAGYLGHGMTSNGLRTHVSGATHLGRARLTIPKDAWPRGRDGLAATLHIPPSASVAYKLARVAAGLDDGTFSVVPRNEWSTCAGTALVLAAGGRVTLSDGRNIRFNRQDRRQNMELVAAGPKLHPALLETVRHLHSASVV